eukprot:3380131-Pleurochrysis_carterae.AAC.1
MARVEKREKHERTAQTPTWLRGILKELIFVGLLSRRARVVTEGARHDRKRGDEQLVARTLELKSATFYICVATHNPSGCMRANQQHGCDRIGRKR